MNDRILFQFENDKQAKAFFEWFKNYGFDQFIMSDSVRDDLAEEDLPQCISADELPGQGCSDPDSYYIEIQ